MKNGICPKCESHEVYHKDTVMMFGVHIDFWNATPSNVFICVNCGYTERYIISKFDKVAEKWKKVES